MDKRKQKTIKEIRKKIGLDMQDRRNFLNVMINVKNAAESIKLQEGFINDLKAQLEAGIITEVNRHGQKLTKQHLSREIKSAEFQLNQMKLQLDYHKEDLYYKLFGKEGLIEKAGSFDKLIDNIEGHYLMVRDEVNKLTKKLGEKSAI